MFLDEIKVIETSPCLADEKLFKAKTQIPVSLTELLPYLNAIVEKPDYQPDLRSLIIKKGIIKFTLQDTSINITRFANITELYELLDWIKALINDTYERRSEIKPSHKVRKVTPVLTIYKLLPKKNCKECGENSCMAFAARLNKLEVEIDNCPLLLKDEFLDLRQKLKNEME